MAQQQIAVALQYPADAEVPFIAVNTKGLLADAVLRIAEENNVPVRKDVVLANVLSMHDVGSCVPPETYEALAKIFAFIQKYERRESGTDKKNKHR